MKSNIFESSIGIILVGAIIGLGALFLQFSGNPGNMGLCVVCFERDMAGALGFHSTGIVQYLRPEIIGLALGSFIAAILFGDFKPRGGSSPIIRFCLGMIGAVCALVFLGCPWRVLLRIGGGDLNALFALGGFMCGAFLGVQFLKRGYSLGQAQAQSKLTGLVFPILMLCLLALYFLFPQIEGEGQSGVLRYSVSGPGSQHAPVMFSLAIALVIGFCAQRSRFCVSGAFRNLFRDKDMHLIKGLIALVAAVTIGNIALGTYNLGFENQPVAHTDSFWNFFSMFVAGLAFALAGACPGRQLFLTGEGNNDSVIFVLGIFFGTALAHNFMLASSTTGIGAYGAQAVIIGLIFCLVVAITHIKKI